MKKYKAVSAILCMFASLSFVSCGGKKMPKINLSEEIKNIGDLAVMECYYHDVVKLNKTKSAMWAKDKTIWMEFSSKVKLGVDALKIDIVVNENDVKVYIPAPHALSTPDIKPDTIKTFSSKDGIFKTEVTPEDILKKIDEAKKNVRDKIDADESLMHKAELRTKEIVSNYIKQIGELNGIEYNISWMTEPLSSYEDAEKPEGEGTEKTEKAEKPEGEGTEKTEKAEKPEGEGTKKTEEADKQK